MDNDTKPDWVFGEEAADREPDDSVGDGDAVVAPSAAIPPDTATDELCALIAGSADWLRNCDEPVAASWAACVTGPADVAIAEMNWQQAAARAEAERANLHNS